jgi:hypothetical protein
MKKLLIPLLSVLLLVSSPSFAETKKKTVTPKETVQSVDVKKEKYYKVEWFVKKTGKLVATRSSVISFSDPENQVKTGKIVFSPQRIPVGNSSYLLGLGIDMKLFENNGSTILGMVGIYTDPNTIFDFTEKMPDEQNVAHVVVHSETQKFSTGQSVTLNQAKFFKAYDISKPNNQEITFTRFIIKEPDSASLIEISFKIYEFDVSEKDKPK